MLIFLSVGSVGMNCAGGKSTRREIKMMIIEDSESGRGY
jgi:hypothetical protein